MMIELEQGGAIEVRRIGSTQIVLEMKSLDRASVTRTCPRCGQQPGRPCTTRTGRTDGAVHGARWGKIPAEALSYADAVALIRELTAIVDDAATSTSTR